MTQEDSIRHWIDGAERMLKAKYIAIHHKEPPMTHKLLDLCSMMNIALTAEEKDRLTELTSFSAFARYGDESWLEAEATDENCAHWIKISSAFPKRFRP